ncbi:MAG: transporter substrate-binding domain-containing protein [Lachnospiraceae bacterium]|nr:transporter substrate-binding domain-containing protein [Lachnospiraceae bacterium]
MNRIKKIGAAVMAAGLALSVSGCSGKTVDSVKAIQEAGVFKVAIVDSGNIYTSMDGTTPVGMEPELVETIAAALGVPVEYQVMNHDAALQAVTDGTADIALGCINGSLSLTENYLFTTSYGKGFFYVVTEKGDYAQSAGAFANSAVGMNKDLDDDLRAQIAAAEGVTISEYPNAESVAADIKSGEIRAYICREDEAKALLSDQALQVQNLFDVEPDEYVIVTGNEDQTLVNGMNTLIAQFLTKE